MDIKKIAIIGAVVLVILGCVLTAGCTSTTTTQQQTASNDKSWIPVGMTFNFEPVGTEYDQFYDLGNYLVLLKENKNVNVSKAIDTITNAPGVDPVAGCSVAAKHNDKGEVIFGRNMDAPLTQYPAFISINNFGKYKTLTLTYVASYLGRALNGKTYKEMLNEGKIEDNLYNSIPFLATDAFNEKGLYIEADMRNGDNKLTNEGTNPGRETVSLICLPSLVAANCATVKESLDFIKNEYNWITKKSDVGDGKNDWNMAFMIGDANGEFGLIEIADDKIRYVPYQPAQTNYYLSPYFNLVSYGQPVGVGRLEKIYDGLAEPNTASEMQRLLTTAYIKCNYLNVDSSYLDSNGEIHFVDKNGNPSIDWRDNYLDELLYSIPVDENGKMISQTGYEDGYYAYLEAQKAGDATKMEKNKSDYEKHKAYLDRCTIKEIYNPENFNVLKEKIHRFLSENKYIEKLEKYYAGDEEPLRNDTTGKVWLSVFNIGVNCTEKHMNMKFWERDNLTIDFQW